MILRVLENLACYRTERATGVELCSPLSVARPYFGMVGASLRSGWMELYSPALHKYKGMFSLIRRHWSWNICCFVLGVEIDTEIIALDLTPVVSELF